MLSRVYVYLSGFFIKKLIKLNLNFISKKIVRIILVFVKKNYAQDRLNSLLTS